MYYIGINISLFGYFENEFADHSLGNVGLRDGRGLRLYLLLPS